MIKTILKPGFKRFFVISVSVLAIMILFNTNVYATADDTYYNTGLLTSTEISNVTMLPVGTVIVMSPTDNQMYVGVEAENLIINGTVKTISMPGVGSSSIGSAAFAKHIATERNEYVAGITVGLGDDTAYTEGIEGYFIGRPSNVAGVYYTEPASAKLVNLYARGARPTLLVGHSKGNMDLANALYKMYNDGNRSWYEGVRFITFGCGVYVPAGVGTFNQYVGSFDSLGISNTVNFWNLTYVYGRYHTTNPYYSWTYMPIGWYLN